jgi:hypothetical protein
MLAGVDFSARPIPADLGRVERVLLDAGRRGVPGRGTMVLEYSPTQMCTLCNFCWRVSVRWNLRVRWEVASRVRGESHRELNRKGQDPTRDGMLRRYYILLGRENPKFGV